IFLVNHSCEPTCGFRGQITLVAMRDIKRDEQITFDYAMTDWGSPELGWTEMRCACGSALCRGHVGFKDWESPDLQLRYHGYFSRYIQDAINAIPR
ncbi:MAG: SET domain-containing protein-lysine N-methyltransferase, partial [Deltaproteobacteria bacterium]